MQTEKQSIPAGNARGCLVFLVAGLAVGNLLLTLLTDALGSRFISLAWQTVDWSAQRYTIDTVSLDSRGEPWYIEDLSVSDKYRLRHVTDTGQKSWDLPALDLTEVDSSAIVPDPAGRPWLILGTRLAQWDGAQWAFMPTPLGANLRNYRSGSILVQDLRVWGIDYVSGDGARVIRLDLGQTPVQAQALALPAELEGQQFQFDHLVLAADQSLWALLCRRTIKMYPGASRFTRKNRCACRAAAS